MGSLPLPGTFSPELGSRMPNAILTDGQLRALHLLRKVQDEERESQLVPASGDGNRRNKRPELDHWPKTCNLESFKSRGVVQLGEGH